MVVINVFDPKVVVGRGPSWSRKGLVLRRYNPVDNPTKLQVQAWVNLAGASRTAAGATTQLSGATRVLEMNRLVSAELRGRGLGPGGAYAVKKPARPVHGWGFLDAQARKHGVVPTTARAAPRAAPMAQYGGGGALW